MQKTRVQTDREHKIYFTQTKKVKKLLFKMQNLHLLKFIRDFRETEKYCKLFKRLLLSFLRQSLLRQCQRYREALLFCP